MDQRKKERKANSKVGLTFLFLLGFFSLFFLVSLFARILQPLFEGRRYEGEVIRVEVLNGCGVTKISQQITDILQEKGFDVVNVGDALSHDFAKTILVDRKSEEMRNAKKVARSIGCRHMTYQLDPSLHLEVSLIVGKDYPKIFKIQ